MSDTDDGTVDIHQILAPWKEGDEVSEGWKLGDVRDPFPGVFEVEIVSTGEEPALTMRLFARDDEVVPSLMAPVPSAPVPSVVPSWAVPFDAAPAKFKFLPAPFTMGVAQ